MMGWTDSRERSVLREGIDIATVLFGSLQAIVPPLQWVEIDGRHNWNYVERLPEQAMVLKLARQISSANALDTLINGGFIQEVGSLMRGLDEINEDIIFLSMGISAGKWTANHDSYLEYFWGHALGQPPVQRKTIRAYVNRVIPEQANTSHADAMGRELYSAFSDFVHARSSPIYGLVSGPPPRFYLNGIRYPEAISPFVQQAPSYGFRCIVSATAIGGAISPAHLGPVAYKAFRTFEREHGAMLLPGA